MEVLRHLEGELMAASLDEDEAEATDDDPLHRSTSTINTLQHARARRRLAVAAYRGHLCTLDQHPSDGVVTTGSFGPQAP